MSTEPADEEQSGPPVPHCERIPSATGWRAWSLGLKLLIAGALIFVGSFGTCSALLWSRADPVSAAGGVIGLWGVLLGAVLVVVGLIVRLVEWIVSRLQWG